MWLLGGALVAFAYLWGLGALPLLGPDEPRYAQVAREMFLRGDVATPTLGGHTWFEKPVLLYWAMMAAYAAFGVSEFAARLGPALAGLLTILLVGWVASRAGVESEDEAGWLGAACALVAATCAGHLVFARAASFDILLTATVALALACFYVAEREEDAKRARALLACFYAGVGLSLLAKGLVGVVLPAGVLAAYFLLCRRRPRFSRLGLWWGAPLALAVALVWYGPVVWRHGWQFVDEFFVQHHFARYLSNKYKHPQPFYFYLPVVAMLALPWTAFLAAGLRDSIRASLRRAGGHDDFRAFALAWLAAPVIFFSLSGSKLPGYVLPALPGAALLAGISLARYLRGAGGTRTMRATGLLVLLALGGVGYAVAAGLASPACGVAAALPICAAGGMALFAPAWRRSCAASVAGAALASVLLAVGCGADVLARRGSVRDLLARADAEGYAAWRVYYLLTNERTGEFYASGRLGYQPDGETIKFDGEYDVAEALRSTGEGRALILVQTHFVHRLTNYAPLETKVIADNGAVAVAAVRLR